MPFRYALGFMLGGQWLSLYGPDTVHAFGHLGFTNIVSWADPERQVAAALMTSGKPLLYPEIYYVWNIMRQIGLACPKERVPGVGVQMPKTKRNLSAGGAKSRGAAHNS